MLRSIYRVGTVLFSFALALVFVMAGSELHAQAAEPATQVKQVSTSTEPTAGGYVLSYSDNEATRSATATLKIGTKYTLALRSPDVLVIKDGQDKTIESLASYKQQLEQRYPEVAVGAWILATDHEATITISQKPTATGLYGEEKSAPQVRHGTTAWPITVSTGALAGAVAGCGASAEIGCIEGVAPERSVRCGWRNRYRSVGLQRQVVNCNHKPSFAL